MMMLNKEALDSSPSRRTSIYSVMEWETGLFKRVSCGGGVILVVDMCPHAPPL